MAKSATQHGGDLLGQGFSIAQVVHDYGDEHHSAHLGEAKAPSGTLEQLLAQGALERVDLPAQGGLRQTKLRRGAGHRSFPRHHPELRSYPCSSWTSSGWPHGSQRPRGVGSLLWTERIGGLVMLRILGWVCLFTCALSYTAGAQPIKPSPDRQVAWQRFTSEAGSGWSVTWDAALGAPTALRGPAGAAPLRGWATNRRVAIQNFFEEHADLFGLRVATDAFSVVGESEMGGIQHLRAQQFYRGIPVLGGEYMVSAGAEGDLRIVLGQSVPLVSVDIAPTVSADRAIQTATFDRNVTPILVTSSSALAILHTARGDHLVYSVTLVQPGRPFAWNVFVDAHTGEVIDRQDLVEQVIPGANVYRIDPTIPYEDLPLQRLTGDGSLSGQFVVTHNDAGVDAYSATGDFHYDSSPTSAAFGWFDQANAYWHVDHFIGEFMWGLGYRPDSARRVIANVGDQIIGRTSFTIDNSVFLTRLAPNLDCARAADIIYHECTHAVANGLGIKYGELPGGPGLPWETVALDEATSDYFAAAATSDPQIGEYIFGNAFHDWVNKSAVDYNYDRYTDILNACQSGYQQYCVSMIWSGALWDLRTAVGAVADSIVLESLYYYPSYPIFASGADAIRQVDRDLHGGAHTDSIEAVFARRRIGISVPQVAISGPTQLGRFVVGTFSASAHAGLAPYTYQWSEYLWIDDPPAPLGTGQQQQFSSNVDFTIQCVVTDVRGGQCSASQYVHVGVSPPTVPGPVVTLTGPTSLAPNQMGIFQASVSGGTAPFRYVWTRRSDCSYSWDDFVQQCICGCSNPEMKNILTIGRQNLDSLLYIADFVAAVTVTDSHGLTGDATKYVTVDASNSAKCGSVPIPCPGTPGYRSIRVTPDLVLLSASRDHVEFEVRTRQFVRLSVCDVAGREVARIADGEVGPGVQRFTWDSRTVPSGVYFYKLTAGSKIQVRRVVIVK